MYIAAVPSGDAADGPENASPVIPSQAAADTESPFTKVPEPLRPALTRRGFAQLTAVQSAVLAANDGVRDLQITSQTGSGKTVALGFVLAERLLGRTPRVRGANTLVIAPTRELAMQVKEELAWLYADCRDVLVECVTGGTNVGQERFRLARKPSIVVGTPGRLLDHVTNGVLDCSGVTQLVLDEADQMLDMGFRDELDGILAALPAERRTHLVSATFPPEVVALARRYQQEPLHVEGTARGTAHADIEHIAHAIGPRDRYAALVNLLLMAGDDRTLVFVRTRQDTQGLADKLAGDGFAALPISGDLAQAQRTRTLAAFRRGTISTLVATDVAARGLDIPNVTMVVHVDPPIDFDTYTHRSGRTGRAGQKGRSIMLAPRPRENMIRRLLSQAKVKVQWLPVPDAAAVRARMIERLGTRVRGELSQVQPCAAQRALAAQLLEGKAADEVVAGLLAAMTQEQTREPFPFHDQTPHAPSRASVPFVPPPPMPTTRAHAAPTGDVVPPPFANSLQQEHRGRPRAKPAWSKGPADDEAPPPPMRRGTHETPHEQGYTRFRINWGRSNGGEPKRILAHVCRRGDIESRAVGAIDMQMHYSTFEVRDAVAQEFARRVEKRDRRDPELVITMEGARHRSPRAHEREHAGEGE